MNLQPACHDSTHKVQHEGEKLIFSHHDNAQNHKSDEVRFKSNVIFKEKEKKRKIVQDKEG